MSTLLYGALTRNREASSPKEGLTYTLEPAPRVYELTGLDAQAGNLTITEGAEPKTNKVAKWQDVAAALVPAEVLAIATTAVALQTTEGKDGKPVLTTDTQALLVQFLILLGLPIVLFLITRLVKKSRFEPWDILRALIPSLAFVAWTMLQTQGMWGAVKAELGFSMAPGTEFVVAASLALILGGIAAGLASVADATTPPGGTSGEAGDADAAAA